jgi:hypothetical protein
VSNAAAAVFENLNEKLATMKEQRETLIKWKELSKKKSSSIPLKKDDKDQVRVRVRGLELGLGGLDLGLNKLSSNGRNCPRKKVAAFSWRRMTKIG